ncbi:hypothetical protein [Providencia burhodogranariea]|uniref:Lipoprotein n=1 Tax=Providencia burhodogranariea DSM 19968 TaxID=1141662 RepID=K8WWS4_9GAMM|nr:hypothetical protein [Providencia burhodogranariea]EKT65053.1 hypothetical protein OOA_00910 [Providencia burhodogranariea DSM 19968]
MNLFKKITLVLVVLPLTACGIVNREKSPTIPNGISPESALSVISETPLKKIYNESFVTYTVPTNKIHSWDESYTKSYVDYCFNEGYQVYSVTAPLGAYIRCVDEKQDVTFQITKTRSYSLIAKLSIADKNNITPYMNEMNKFAKSINAETPFTKSEIKFLEFSNEHEKQRQGILNEKKQLANSLELAKTAGVGTYACFDKNHMTYIGSIEQITNEKFKIYISRVLSSGYMSNIQPETIWINKAELGWYICDFNLTMN